MKPPKVSRALLKAHDMTGTGAMVARIPMGLLPASLPRYYLAAPRDGSLLVMEDRSKSPDGATGPQVCLATIAPAVVAQLVAAKGPQPLEVK